MPRPRARAGFCDLRLGSHSPLRGIEGINQQLVESKVGDDSKAIVRRECDRMGVRSFLPREIHAGALVLHERCSLAVEVSRLVDCVKESTAGIDHEERWLRGFCRKAE